MNGWMCRDMCRMWFHFGWWKILFDRLYYGRLQLNSQFFGISGDIRWVLNILQSLKSTWVGSTSVRMRVDTFLLGASKTKYQVLFGRLYKLHLDPALCCITLFRSMTMLCGIDNILQDILIFRLNVKTIPHNIVLDLNNVMWWVEVTSFSWIFY